MSDNLSATSRPVDSFRTFPDFSSLEYSDRKRYEAISQTFPPYSCISFSNLMIWWNDLDCCAVSLLNGNLIISYWLPGDEKVTGLSVVGYRKLDETFCQIFDHLKSTGERPRLVHVPDFVVRRLEHHSLFTCKEELGVDEYVLGVSRFYKLSGLISLRRMRVKKFIARNPKETVVIAEIDVKLEKNKDLLRKSANNWRPGGILKNFVKHMDDSMVLALNDADMLDTQCLSLFINGVLEGFILYFKTHDSRYVTLSHALFSGNNRYAFDYALYAFAGWFHDKGVEYVNIDSDLGIPALRMLKVAIGPDHFFRYYTVEPAE